MTDRYTDLRAALERVEKFDHPDVVSTWLHQATTVRALLAECDRLREFLDAKMDALPADIQYEASMVLAEQEQGGSDGNQD